MDVGLKIKIARIKKGLTQQQLAELSGVSEPTICHIENNKHKSLNSIGKVCKVLDLDLENLLTTKNR